ncbi:MAG: toll/interleukin-1 receptor domain-containing protein [bacterium]|jgi:hypothetical protein
MSLKKGSNRAETYKGYGVSSYRFTESSFSTDICIFLSYIRIDRGIAAAIGDYIKNAGFDIYLDLNDQELERAVQANDAARITRCIEDGVNASSHLMCLVSEDTVRSWWVPYEIGYAKKGGKRIATLTLKDTKRLPAYLAIGEVLLGTKSLNEFLNRLLRNYITESEIFRSSVSYGAGSGYLIKHTAQSHPLDAYLEFSG